MYPSVCLSGCTDDFDSTLTDDEKKLIEADDYVVKFKIVEIYEKFNDKEKICIKRNIPLCKKIKPPKRFYFFAKE